MITDKPTFQVTRPVESLNKILELTPPEKTALVESRKIGADWPNRSQDSSDSDQLENGYEEDMENGRE
jgi:hypothetical protein